MNKQLKGFMSFIREQGVVGLAVGLAIGLQVGATTNAMVDGFINPIVTFVLSFIMDDPKNLERMTWTISGPPHPLILGWGLVLSYLIKLVAVAAVIYFVVHGLGLDRLDKKKDEAVEDKKADKKSRK